MTTCLQALEIFTSMTLCIFNTSGTYNYTCMYIKSCLYPKIYIFGGQWKNLMRAVEKNRAGSGEN